MCVFEKRLKRCNTEKNFGFVLQVRYQKKHKKINNFDLTFQRVETKKV